MTAAHSAAPPPAWARLDISGMRNGNEDYDIDARTPDVEGLLQRFQSQSESARSAPGMVHDSIAYGEHPLAVADLFRPAQGPVRGTVVFVHGGYWKGAGRPNRAFLAPAWVREGVQWVNVGYPVAPDTPMPRIADYAGGALRAIMEAQKPFDRVRGPLVLSGNSAGAHLLALALASRAPGKKASGGGPGECAPGGAAAGASGARQAKEDVAGCMLLSGLYELEPLLELPSREWMRLDRETAAGLSPLRLAAPELRAPVLVTVGADEPEAFLAQSRAYARHLLGHAQVDYQEMAGLNHLTMIAALESPRAPLGRIVARWLGLASQAG